MPKHTALIFKTPIVLSLIFLTACGALLASPPPPPTAEPDPTSTAPQVAPLPTYPPLPTITLSTITPPTETVPSSIIPLTTDTPDNSLAELNARIEELEITVTAAAREIAALQSQNDSLATKAASSSGNGGSSSSSNPEYDIPSNVVEITIIQNATLRDQVGTNNKGAPVMGIREPRVKLPPGTHSWVTDSRIKADGGVIYYEIYDPDGEVSRVFFVRLKDIQIREIGAQPFSDNIPLDVILVDFLGKSFVRSITKYTDAGRPVMRINEPRIQFNAGDRIWIRVVPIIADGGSVYYEVFDQDGQTTNRYFIRKQDISIPNFFK